MDEKRNIRMSSQYIQEARSAMGRVFSTMGECRGTCARHTYNMAKAFAYGTTPDENATGIADMGTEAYYNGLEALGYTRDKKGIISKQALINDIMAFNYPCGTVITYQNKWSGETQDSSYKYGHTQFYIGKGWTSSLKYNYGKNGRYVGFVYTNRKSDQWDYNVFTPPAPKAAANEGSTCNCNPGESSKAIGKKNNNPLNIRNSNDCFDGECDCDKSFGCTKNNNNFKTFVNMDYGYRAAFVVIGTYVDKYGCNTVRKIIEKWAPPNENNTSSYIENVGKDISFSVDEALYLTGCGDKFRQLVKAMSTREIGWYDVNAIQEGFNLQSKIKE